MTQQVPLARGADGVLRLAGSRVTLDSVMRLFKGGATAEQIREDFPSLALGDIYAVIAYYLRNSRKVDDYLRQQATAAQALQTTVEARMNTRGLRERLRQRRPG